jgi:hypothetical protein
MIQRNASKWRDHHAEPLNEDAIRNLYRPAKLYRISLYRYGVGVEFDSALIEADCYVLQGICEFSGPIRIELAYGEYALLPTGSYHVKSIGIDDLVLVYVWKLPS